MYAWRAFYPAPVFFAFEVATIPPIVSMTSGLDRMVGVSVPTGVRHIGKA
jgi:hypothetical protein